MKRKLVFFPSDPISAYIEKGRTYAQLEEYYNPGDFFDEVYCLSPWGERQIEKIGKIHYIKADVLDFKKIINRIKPNVVRAYGGYCCSDWVSISKVKGIPYVVSVHDTNPVLIHDSLKYADAIICMSKGVREAVLKKVNITHNNIYVMGNRVDINIFNKKNDNAFFEKLNHEFGEEKHLLLVGRKTEQKNIDNVIKSLMYLENYSCVFIGKGETKQYEELAKTIGCEDKCYFIQSVRNTELPYWYSWCDCFLTPSRWEGFGIVFIEAAACESLIITSDISPMNEFLSDGKNAILIKDYEDPRAIAEAVLFAEKNPNLVREIKKNARAVGYEFSKEKIDEQEVSIYKRIMNLEPNNLENHELREYLVYTKASRGTKALIKISLKIKSLLS